MKILLDTHVLIWSGANDARLSPVARAAIEDPVNEVFYSAASIWEMAIKASLGKLKFHLPLVSLEERLDKNGFTFLPVEFAHAARVENLPLHHGDPFDRLLIAQALVEGMSVVSTDEAFDAYAVQRIW